MDLVEVERVRAEPRDFCGEVFSSIPRRDSRAWGECYLRGLMLEGKRKSIQPMAERLPDGDMQALQQFVGQSPWDRVPVRRRVAAKASRAIGPDAWVIDDTSFPKDRVHSVGAARQWCGALGKTSLCQVAVSLHAVTEAASVPLDWRLYLPGQWAGPADERRVKAGVPERVGHRAKWRLGLDMVDEALGRGLAPPVVVADAGYGQNRALRAGLAERGLDYVVAVRGGLNAHPGHAVPETPERTGRRGPSPAPRSPDPARPLADLVLAQGRTALRRCTWRQGSKGRMRSRFTDMAVRPAGAAATTAARAAAGAGADWDGALPAKTLIAEWPPHHEAPTDYWLSSLPGDTAPRRLVRLAKIRWRIEHDYCELKHEVASDGPIDVKWWRGRW